VPVLNQISPDHFFKIHFNIILFTPRSSKLSLSFMFPHQNPVGFCSLPIRATCPTHVILLDFITPVKLREKFKSWSSSICSFLQSHVTFSLLGLSISWHRILEHAPTMLLNQGDRPSFTPIKSNRQTCSSVYFHLFLYSKAEDKNAGQIPAGISRYPKN
jgi:hypothetical protein